MADVTELDNYRPHMTVRTEDGNVHVLPLSNIIEYVNGKRALESVAGADSDEIVRALLKDYLRLFGSGW